MLQFRGALTLLTWQDGDKPEILVIFFFFLRLLLLVLLFSLLHLFGIKTSLSDFQPPSHGLLAIPKPSSLFVFSVSVLWPKHGSAVVAHTVMTHNTYIMYRVPEYTNFFLISATFYHFLFIILLK